ncbi:MAG: zf-HC2 domain-containing protein [Chthoniobacteraceae bacterium]
MIEPTNWWKTKLVMFIAEHTPKCHDITLLLSESLDRPLPLRTRIAIRIHFLICVWCKRYRDQLGLLRRALHSSAELGTEKMSGGLSPDARTRLKIAVKPKT